MGVLDDSDIEKLEQAFQKKKIGKIFYDPRKAKDAFSIVLIIAFAGLYASLILGWGFFAMQDAADYNKSQFNDLRDTVISNSDCPTLIQVYHELQTSHSLPNTKNLIKDEIAFRCK